MKYDVIGGRPSNAFPGTLTRVDSPYEVVSYQPDPTNPPTRLGDPVVLDGTSGLPRKLLISDFDGTTHALLAPIFGFVVRQYPVTNTTYPPTADTIPGSPATGETLSIARGGYLNVFVTDYQGTPVTVGAPVRVANETSSNLLGSIQASAQGGDATLVATFASAPDVNGFAEIRITGNPLGTV